MTRTLCGTPRGQLTAFRTKSRPGLFEFYAAMMPRHLVTCSLLLATGTLAFCLAAVMLSLVGVRTLPCSVSDGSAGHYLRQGRTATLPVTKYSTTHRAGEKP
jgi:hypothetical protein